MISQMKIRTTLAAITSSLVLTASAVPGLLNYQGKLLDPETNQALTDGPHTLVFQLHDSATDGNVLWGPFSITANTSNGFFNVILGPSDTTDPPREIENAFGNSDSVFLSISVDGGTPLEPRQQILSGPFAFKANFAEETSELTGTWTVPAGQPATIKVGGSEVFSVTDPPPAGVPVRATLKEGHFALDPDFGIFSFDDSSPREIRAGIDTSPAGDLTIYSFGSQKIVLREDRILPFRNATNATANGSDTGIFLGDSGFAWKAVYALHGTIRSSDERLKTKIEDLDYGLDEVMALRPTRYNWKTTPDAGSEIGLIAQELQAVIPEAVNIGSDEDKTLGVTYTDLIPVLINGMQEQQAQIEALKAKLAELRNIK